MSNLPLAYQHSMLQGMEYHLERQPVDKTKQAIRFINQTTLGQLVTVDREGFPQASNLVFEAREREGEQSLLFHIPQRFAQFADLEASEEALALFTGPHGYISPSWYKQPSAPTWDFVAIQVRGAPERITEEALLDHLKIVTRYQEADLTPSFSLDQLDNGYLKKYLGQIAGFEVPLDDIEIRYKLSQDKDAATREVIKERLIERKLPLDAPLALAMMREERSPSATDS